MAVPHIFLALITVFLWGFNFVVIKVGVMDMPPLFLTALRYFFAAVPLIFFLPRPKVPWKHMIVYGMVMGCAQFGLLYTAIKWGLPAGLASLVMQSQAFFTMALAVTLLGEIPLKSHIAGAAVAFGGLAVIGLERLNITAMVPLLMCVGAAFSWAIGNIVNRKVGRVNAVSFIAWTSLVPVLPLVILSLVLEDPQAIADGLTLASPMTVMVVIYMAYGATIVGAGIWSYLLSRYPAGTVAPFSLLVPIVGFLGAYFAFNEEITLFEVIGSSLVVAGLALNVFGRRISFAGFRSARS
ncbi:EamA family transporter [Agrobacterium rosae]|uniref:EamA family transporter n=1 Tax=Agrobacterium rosae TaxID=1972867 RepID=A0AAE5VNS8_9HYPH|nr:EamA family transporter [Agrobacterium rosae]KAA3509986.1 O-acetylserine/cysteine exporter [Agrobacterium rosae]KAA3515070.1 O-acetylserine/cysteine exporter [Agrobacterium rosae]MCM2433241.1 EamA family transporter [Agrobacterium rosae]MDX8331535.1 EamA family transporter [Agrobacterium rosae]MQB50589.1 O-acetylserine/cysteine exporter [Agrobacterium rosae]